MIPHWTPVRFRWTVPLSRAFDHKSLKRRILATTPPTDILHRATLINTALVPLYNHVLIALPISEQELQPLNKEILSFLWTRTVDSETVQKRRLVAKKRLSASFHKGGLQIQNPTETAEGLRINLIQKCFKKIAMGTESKFTQIVERLLTQKWRPTLATHINRLGPAEWSLTGDKIMNKKLMLGLAFKSMAKYLVKLEESPEKWHLAPVRGHSRIHKLFPFYPAGIATLETQGIITVSQLFETHLSGRIENSVSTDLMTAISQYPMLQHKVRIFVRDFSQQIYHNKYMCPRTNLALLINQDTNLSRRYRLRCRDLLDESIGVAPAYQTRIRDGIAICPGQRTFNSAYNLLHLPLITSKTRETAFQILYGTTWTNNKAFKSRIRGDPNCDRCGETETMEHLLCECEYYSECLWNRLAEILTIYYNDISTTYVPRVDLGQTNIIFNIPHPSLLLYIPDKETQNAILLLVQEIKRDIIYRRMNLPQSAQQVRTRKD